MQRASVEDIRKFREAEIKHGRVAMLAALGIIVGEEVEFGTPLYGDKIVGPAIYQVSDVHKRFFYINLFFICPLYHINYFVTFYSSKRLTN